MFWIDNIFVSVFFKRQFGIHMGDNCALLADVPQLQHGLLTPKKLSQSFNCTFRYTDDVLSLSNS